ncbi:coth-domain-containing protein [Backusella circina FSU 941]|nr:coth-domain-containing protein [Backusella circina FSU 941]
MGVVVDDQVYPLSTSEKTSLLHTGEAPIASQGYSYALLKEGDIVIPENFTRAPVESDTVNEYFNRSWNKWELDQLPIVLPPLPIIDRIDSDLHIDGQIPTIHFVGNQSALDYLHDNQANEDIEVSVNMTYISLENVQNLKDITLQISGFSTRMFPKLSYKLKIPKNQDLFGYRRLKLRAITGTDYSYMKEYLAYDMYRSVGLPTTKFSYVRLYMNDEPIGLFGLAENFKNPWIRNEFAKGSKDYKQGTFYAADANGGVPFGQKSNSTENQDGPSKNISSDLTYLGHNVSLYSRGYYSVKEDPSKGKANFTRIMDLSKFIADASNTTTDDSVVPLWEKKMDVDSFLRGMAMEFLLSNTDGYFANANNYLMYDDLENERLLFSGSDFDLTMGMNSINNTMGGNYSEYSGFTSRPLSKMLNVPKFKKDFESLLLNITQGLINPDVLYIRINQTYQMLLDDVAWDKSLPKKGHFSFRTQVANISESEMENMMYNLISFDAAVNGPMPKELTSLLIPLKEWVKIRSENILNYFNQTQ